MGLGSILTDVVLPLGEVTGWKRALCASSGYMPFSSAVCVGVVVGRLVVCGEGAAGANRDGSSLVLRRLSLVWVG